MLEDEEYTSLAKLVKACLKMAAKINKLEERVQDLEAERDANKFLNQKLT